MTLPLRSSPMNRWSVLLRSEEYGEEAFTYPTLDEALDGIRRLANAVREERDGVEREISLCVSSPRKGRRADAAVRDEEERC
jgi:hypothetical protein